MKIATMATGGIGGFLAARLANNGHDVATIARGAHLDAIRSHGLRLITPDQTIVARPWAATDNTEDVGPVDAVIFGVKGDDLELAAEACRPMLGDETIVVPFLNGVEAADRLAQILPPQNVGNGVAYISTTISEPGTIRQTGDFNRFIFAERDNSKSPRISALQQAIDEAGSSAPATDNIEAEVWKKFILFAAVSGITASARCTMQDIRDSEPLAALFRTVISETTSVARARGVALTETISDDTWAAAQGMPAAMRASTAIDLEAGRPLEIEWISGAVVRLAAHAGISVPVNTALYALLSPYRNGARDR